MILKHTQNPIQSQKPFQAPDAAVQKMTTVDFALDQNPKAQSVFNMKSTM